MFEKAPYLELCVVRIFWCVFQIRDNKRDFSEKQWELFECEVYLEEVSDVLCIAQAGMSFSWQGMQLCKGKGCNSVKIVFVLF